MSAYHEPVLLDEIVAAFSPLNNKIIVDGTVGGAGHAKALIEEGAYVVGIDTDSDALKESERVLSVFGKNRYTLVHGSYADIQAILADVNIPAADGVLLDLGLSSHQIDEVSRGFSYRTDGPLDMRFDRSVGRSARDIVNGYGLEDLYEIISRYGEEKRARAICLALVRARAVRKFETTGDLVRVIKDVAGDHDAMSVMSRVFQALRIEVNSELDTVRKGILEATDVLKTGGKLAIITFQSLEDRIVKLMLNRRNDLKNLTKKPLTVARAESEKNIRSRSAKLRIYRKI